VANERDSRDLGVGAELYCWSAEFLLLALSRNNHVDISTDAANNALTGAIELVFLI
jgi:hypothetical protein